MSFHGQAVALFPNGEDPDMDGDGIPNEDDPTPNGCVGDCCGSTDPCCGVESPCDPLCGNPCAPQCIDCDDDNPCTADSCEAGACFHEPVCDPDVACCEGDCCAAGEMCCQGNTVCCGQECQGCIPGEEGPQELL